MAKIERVELIDDFDGKTIENMDDYGKVEFSIKLPEWRVARNFEMDIRLGNSEKVAASSLNKLMEKATQVRGGRRLSSLDGKRPSGTDPQVQAVRDWANANGYEVADKGRISREVREAFDAAH